MDKPKHTNTFMQTRKQPRDFVSVDELWEADKDWPHYFIDNKVWVFSDEYRAELTGDEDYSRIIIHSSASEGWLFSRSVDQKDSVQAALSAINLPVSEQQLSDLGFVRWEGFYI